MEKYTIKCALVVSQSLLPQKDEEPTNKSVIKALISENNKIVYFIDAVDIGSGTVFTTDELVPLMFPKQYKIVKQVQYEHQKELVEKLLLKAKESK